MPQQARHKMDSVAKVKIRDFLYCRVNIFRFEGGRIVEHWDNLQDKPKKPSPSGHTMTDGPTESKDPDRTEANKELVRRYLEDVLVNGRLERMARYIDCGEYIEHHPNAGAGLDARREAFTERARRGVILRYDTIHKVLGEGNFVLTVSEGRYGPTGGKHVCFYDLFRVEGGKIAEHWDTVDLIPEKERWKNGNSKFGFEPNDLSDQRRGRRHSATGRRPLRDAGA